MSAAAPAVGGSHRGAHRVTQARVIASEWTKFRSLRSTLITLAVVLVLTIGVGALVTGVTAAHWSSIPPAEKAAFNPVVRSLAGVNIAQLAVGVLGVLLISGEYATGSIRSTLTAVPRRLPVLWAKLGVFAAVTAVISVFSTFAAFFLGQSLLSSQHLQVSLSSPHALRMVLGAAAYMLLVGLIGLSLGTVTRNTAAGISSFVALFFVIPPVLQLLPSSWANAIGPYLPSTAGSAFWGSSHGAAHLDPLNGFLVLCAWAAAAIIVAAVRLTRRDA